jgi:hypothetical protein
MKSGQETDTKKGPLLGHFARTTLTVLLVLLVVCIVVVWRTNDAMADLPFLQQGPARSHKTLVDETPWKTAQALSALAVSQEELVLARQAERLADHEVDQAFATALREGGLKQKTLTGNALELQQKVAQLTALVAQDQAALAAVDKGGEDEDIAKAQLGLDQDQLSDAKGDLARASGDQRNTIQQELTQRDAEVKKFEAAGGVGEVAVISAGHYRTLAGLIGAWSAQTKRHKLLLEAKSAAQSDAQKLTAQHNGLESAAKTGTGDAQGADKLAGLKKMAAQRELMSLYDDRIETQGQLADVYDRWASQVVLQHGIVQHLIVVQTVVVIVILIVGILLSAVARRIAERESTDRRRARTLSWIARLTVQVFMLLSILVVVFGSPGSLSTVIGLTTAGLTVALQDFILAFVGWFVLMGRSGIGVGDAVEIDGVQGDVIEIGVFRTTLLETGNWASSGHPTGRRVAFNNKYAISGRYFNFTTSGQWMWDEFVVGVPSGEDVPAVMARVQKAVTQATAKDAGMAETEWQHASGKRGLGLLSAVPAVNVRPVGGGAELVVRYVTRAAVRLEQRNAVAETVLESLQTAHTPGTAHA